MTKQNDLTPKRELLAALHAAIEKLAEAEATLAKSPTLGDRFHVQKQHISTLRSFLTSVTLAIYME